MFQFFLVHDFYSSHVHQMANQAARQSPPQAINHSGSPILNSSSHLHPIHNPTSSYYHHYHHSSSVLAANQNLSSNNSYSSPQTGTQNRSLNGNESPNSIDQFSSNNTIQLPETPNSLLTINMGPTSGNSNSNDAVNPIIESSATENAATISSNNNYIPWCASHQLPLANSTPQSCSPIHSSYNAPPPPHHPPGSLYSAHHNLSSSLISHQSFPHPHSGKSFGMSQPFYSWY